MSTQHVDRNYAIELLIKKHRETNGSTADPFLASPEKCTESGGTWTVKNAMGATLGTVTQASVAALS